MMWYEGVKGPHTSKLGYPNQEIHVVGQRVGPHLSYPKSIAFAMSSRNQTPPYFMSFT